jgi:DegV family protein with EDD domain
MLSHILYAKEEVEKGTKISDICIEIENRKKNSYICFIPENLNALKNGGRISPAAAAIGNTIGLKPIILLQNGELVKDSVTRSPKKKFKEHLDKCIETFPIENYDYSICDFYADELTVGVAKEYLENLIGKENVIRGILPINVCAHCGPGTYGVVISPKINGKSIKEFI